MVRTVFLVFFLTIFGSYYTGFAQSCNNLPATFTSYNDAVSLVKNSSFKIKEDVNTSKSSWIRGASYYSCDGTKGYLIIRTDSKEYIHMDMPIEVWHEFKNADSFGSYYQYHIKGKYQLRLNI